MHGYTTVETERKECLDFFDVAAFRETMKAVARVVCVTIPELNAGMRTAKRL